ncbi:hypothetical protein FGO68_gene8724 [Halteria grandinella]|uniref:Uncharacterized protein n=1 Tax=Halteria grandinella TaxID=5974 RepID=A0A8J8T1V8_HALGN|nr:hypothetical protein FGO68_gene8724 [Halteria grandinella]
MSIMFLLNTLVAGTIAILSLFKQKESIKWVWEYAGEKGECLHMLGCHWAAIAFLSLGGLLINRHTFSLVFVHQLLYKGLYLITSVLPKVYRKEYNRIPKGMACFFVVWCAVLPFLIPWSQLFQSS